MYSLAHFVVAIYCLIEDDCIRISASTRGVHAGLVSLRVE